MTKEPLKDDDLNQEFAEWDADSDGAWQLIDDLETDDVNSRES